MIGIGYRDRQALYDRINRRVDLMLEAGLLDEVRAKLDAAAAQQASAGETAGTQANLES